MEALIKIAAATAIDASSLIKNASSRLLMIYTPLKLDSVYRDHVSEPSAPSPGGSPSRSIIYTENCPRCGINAANSILIREPRNSPTTRGFRLINIFN